MSDTNPESLQSIARRNFNLELPGALRVATGIDLDLEGISYELFGESSNGHSEDFKTLLGGRVASLPGTSGSYWQTADKAQLDITGDIDLRAEIDSVVNTGLNRDIVSKYTPTTQQSFEWRYNAFGSDEFVWSTTGANALTDTAGISNEQAVRFTMDVVNGANRVLTWYYSPGGSIDGSWVQRAQEVVAGNTSIFSSNAVMRIGARGDAAGANAFSGRIRRVEVRNLIDGTLVADPDFRFLEPGTTSFADSVGNTWTAVGNAVVV